ncbi:hypothetical protein TKK_0004778 [Trichogramma kaykai]
MLRVSLSLFKIFLTCIFGYVRTYKFNSVLSYIGLARPINYDGPIDDCIDANLYDVQVVLRTIDPLPVKDYARCGPWLELRLCGGELRHLSLLRRSGGCELRYSGRLLATSLFFEWPKLVLTYGYYYDVGIWWNSGVLIGRISDLNVHLLIEMNFETVKLSLIDFQFTDVGDVSVKSEQSLLDSVIAWLLVWYYRNWILSKMERLVERLIRRKFERLNEKFGRTHMSFGIRQMPYFGFNFFD